MVSRIHRSKVPIFTIIDGEKTYEIYENGEVTGFSHPIVSNRISLVLNQVRALALQGGEVDHSLASPTDGNEVLANNLIQEGINQMVSDLLATLPKQGRELVETPALV